MEHTYPLPMYFVISQEIIADIQKRRIKPGEKISSENEIMQHYNVSNTTARRVLNEVEKQGYVKRVKGKGTYVKEHMNATRSATKVLSFTRNMIQQGFTPKTKLIDCTKEKADYTKMVNGRNYTINGPIAKITRLRYASNQPVMFEVRYISLNSCPGIESCDLEDSLYNIYEKEYQLKIHSIYQTLSAIILDGEQLKHFNREEITPGFRVDGVTFYGKELVLELEESIYCGDFYKFQVEATP